MKEKKRETEKEKRKQEGKKTKCIWVT